MLRAAALSVLLVFAMQDESRQEQEDVAGFLEWLEHPNELGCKPDKVEIIDRRELVWPVGENAGRKRKAMLIRYAFKSNDSERVSVGVAGPLNWSWIWNSFQNQLPPEDVYGLYAAWEMRVSKRIKEIDLPTRDQLRTLADCWKGPALTGVRFREACEVEYKEGKPQLVGLAESVCRGEFGFAVFEGDASCFLPRSVLPDGLWYGHVLPAHIGRRALGLPESKERNRWRKSPLPKGPSGEAQIAYVEKTIRDVKAGKKKLPDPQESRFPEALMATGEALQQQGRVGEFNAILDFLEREWKTQWLWNERLGRAAFKAGLYERAAAWLGDSLNTDKYVGRGDGASLLARSLVKTGKPDEARAVLVRSMQAAVKEFKGEEFRRHLGSQWQLEDWYQGFQTTFLELLGAEASRELQKEGVPNSLMPPAISIPARD